MALLATLLGLAATRAPARSGAQEPQPRSDIPGAYAAGECHPAPFPAQLPPLDNVLDSASLAAALKSAGVDKRVVFGLRLGAFETAPRVHIIEKKVSGQIADRALHEVDASMRVVPTDRDWAFRLRVEGGPDLAATLEHSQVCAAVPGPRSGLVFAVGRASPDSFAQLRRQAQEALRRRRSLLSRVLVDAKGQGVAVELVHSSGDPSMDQSEADALQRRRFTPTQLDGVAVSAWIEVRGDR